jgi:2-iminobutanoate/2-iminopropanoate deaminase
MKKQLILPEGTDVANMAIAPAVRIGDLLFLSGTAGTKNGKLAGPDIESQSRAALERLGQVLEAAGSSFDKVVKVNCFLTYAERDFAGWNKVFKEFFPKEPPARTTVGAPIAMPGAIIEVELIASM